MQTVFNLNPNSIQRELSQFSQEMHLSEFMFAHLSFQYWYHPSKTLAEKAAWEFAKENGIDLVTLHPGLVIGPLLQSTVNVSIQIVLDIINGNLFLLNL